MAHKEITDAQIRHAEIFTAIYQKHEGKSAELREPECLKVQYPATLLPLSGRRRKHRRKQETDQDSA